MTSQASKCSGTKDRYKKLSADFSTLAESFKKKIASLDSSYECPTSKSAGVRKRRNSVPILDSINPIKVSDGDENELLDKTIKIPRRRSVGTVALTNQLSSLLLPTIPKLRERSSSFNVSKKTINRRQAKEKCLNECNAPETWDLYIHSSTTCKTSSSAGIKDTKSSTFGRGKRIAWEADSRTRGCGVPDQHIRPKNNERFRSNLGCEKRSLPEKWFEFKEKLIDKKQPLGRRHSEPEIKPLSLTSDNDIKPKTTERGGDSNANLLEHVQTEVLEVVINVAKNESERTRKNTPFSISLSSERTECKISSLDRNVNNRGQFHGDVYSGSVTKKAPKILDQSAPSSPKRPDKLPRISMNVGGKYTTDRALKRQNYGLQLTNFLKSNEKGLPTQTLLEIDKLRKQMSDKMFL